MIQASTLNVAFNSHNKSLLTIMMSSNVSKNAYMESHIYRGINVFVFHISEFCSLLFNSLWRLKEVCSRNSERTICFKCPTVVRYSVRFSHEWETTLVDQHAAHVVNEKFIVSSHFAFWWRAKRGNVVLRTLLYKNLSIWLQTLSTLYFSIFVTWSHASLSHFCLLYSDIKRQ